VWQDSVLFHYDAHKPHHFKRKNWLIIVTPRFRACLYDVVTQLVRTLLAQRTRNFLATLTKAIYVCSLNNFHGYSTSICLEIQPNTCYTVSAYVSQIFFFRETFCLTSCRYFFFFLPLLSRHPCYCIFFQLHQFNNREDYNKIWITSICNFKHAVIALSLVFPNNLNNIFNTFSQVWRLAVPFIVSLGLVWKPRTASCVQF
jgi:hypothetical protein